MEVLSYVRLGQEVSDHSHGTVRCDTQPPRYICAHLSTTARHLF
jgi:hypothetical protein